MSIYEIVGMAVMVAFSVGIAAVCIAICISVASDARRRSDRWAESATRVALGQRMANSAWWFEPQTAMVLREMSQSLLMGYWWDEDKIRNKCALAKKDGGAL